MSADFTASGDSVDVKYDYTCGPNNSFSADFYGAQQSPMLPDNLVSDDPGQSNSSITTEPLNGMPGPFHIEVDSTLHVVALRDRPALTGTFIPSVVSRDVEAFPS